MRIITIKNIWSTILNHVTSNMTITYCTNFNLCQKNVFLDFLKF